MCLYVFSQSLLSSALSNRGVLASMGWREAWRPSAKVDPGAFSGQRRGWKTPSILHCFVSGKDTRATHTEAVLHPWRFTASVCVAGSSALLGDLLGVSWSVERDLLSVLLIYPRIFLHVFIAYRLLGWFLFVLLYSTVCSCVLVVLVTLSVPAKWLARRTPLMTPLGFVWWGDYLHTAQVEEIVCVFLFLRLVCLCCCVFSRLNTTYFIRPWHDIAWLVLRVPLNTNKPDWTCV